MQIEKVSQYINKLSAKNMRKYAISNSMKKSPYKKCYRLIKIKKAAKLSSLKRLFKQIVEVTLWFIK